MTSSLASAPTVIEHQNLDKLPLYIDAPWFVVDCETLGLQPTGLLGLRTIQLAAPNLPTIFIDVFKLDTATIKEVRSIFRKMKGDWYAHNAIFDYAWLRSADLLFGHQYPTCTMIMAQVLTLGLPRKYNLAALCKTYLNIDLSKEQRETDWSTPDLTAEQVAYAIKDAEILVQLVRNSGPSCTKRGALEPWSMR